MERSIESLHSCHQEVISENAVTNFDDIQEKLDLMGEKSELLRDDGNYLAYFLVFLIK